MTIAQVISSLPGSPSAVDQVTLRAALLNGFFHFIDPDTDPQTVDVTDSDSGAKAWVIGWQEKLWWLDPDDTTTAHDAITSIVTDDGGRYKVVDVDPWHGYAVESATLTTPPDSDSPPPEFGKAWLVPSGASGDWASKVDYIAIWTARSWQFVPPRVGRLLYIIDTETYVHYTPDGDWENFLDTDGSIAPAKLVQGLTNWIVQEIGTNDPPGASDSPVTPPAKGINYIVGDTPTGDFVGHENDIATSDDGIDWDFYSPAQGWEAYNLDDNLKYRFDGTTWNVTTLGYSGASADLTTTSAAISVSGSGGSGYSYSESTAPTQSENRMFLETLTKSVTADFAGQKIEVEFMASASLALTTSGGDIGNLFVTLGVFMDSVANAQDWTKVYDVNKTGASTFPGTTYPNFGTVRVLFEVTLSDTSTHTLKFIFFPKAGATINSATLTLSRRRVIIRKKS